MQNAMTANGALHGVKVLDLGQYVAGPCCAKLLADYGAEVIKVERPDGGDPARHLGPFAGDHPAEDRSLPFLYLNTNRKSITLNLRTVDGRAILRRLISWADILVENFAPRSLPSLGLSYGDLRQANQRLVMTSISNFGQSGPYRDFKATEIVLYALSGMMYISGAYDREPLKHGLPQAAYHAGLQAAYATLFALWYQRDTGRGQHVDVSIAESLSAELYQQMYTYGGVIQRRAPKEGGAVYRFLMPCKNGNVGFTPVGSQSWEAFANLLDAPELAEPRFATARGRALHAAALDEMMIPHARMRERDELFHTAQSWRFAFSPLQAPSEVAQDPQLEARGYFHSEDYPGVGRVKYPGGPAKMSETPWRLRMQAPRLGEHNEEIYGGLLGYGSQELVRLHELQVI
jgi:CoA:oxalate CoA-transferase